MTSQVYYRKWRPSSFGNLVGQEPIATTLRQAIQQSRVSHSYLFCGPRGTGKTSTARILAKAVNCLDVRDGDPCNDCLICRSINEGRFLDIIELDAASNRGIDEIRDIREKINFAPVAGARKVYIIDEAHMLTDQASNAFLKTLEEPPAHVIFILCTTEANKILPTIISRCQRFDFRRIPGDIISQRLTEIIQGEGVVVEPEALRLVARFSSGSLRDAENLLEQLVVSYGDGVTVKHVEELLGLGHGDRWLELVKYLLMGNTSACLEVINQAAWEGTDLRQMQRQVGELLRGAMLLEWGSGDSLDLPEEVTGQLRELVSQLPSWRIVRALKLWSEVNMRYDAPSTLPLELAAVEICDDRLASPSGSDAPSVPQPAAVRRPPQPQASAPSAAPPARSAPQQARAPAPERPDPAGQTPAAARPEPSADSPAPPAANGDADFQSRWMAAVRALNRCKGKKYNLGALLRDCRADSVTLDADTLVLPFSNRTNLERMQEEMEDPNGQRMVTEAVAKAFEASYGFRLTLAGESADAGGPARPAQQSPLVRTAMGMGARIVEEMTE